MLFRSSVLPRLALPELNLAGLRAAALCDASARRAIGLLHRRDRSLSPAAQALAVQLETAMDEIARRLLPLPPLILVLPAPMLAPLPVQPPQSSPSPHCRPAP